MSVLTVVLDAADASLLRRWAEEGELPFFRRILAEGASATLESEGGALPESTWATLTTGAHIGSHGVYNWRPIRPRTYQRTRQPPSTCRKPFWQLVRDQLPDARAVLLDPPFTLPLGDERFIEIVGWGDRGGVHHDSWPPGTLEQVVARHGAFPRWTEDDYVRWPLEERRLSRALENAVARRTDILIDLLGRARWDMGFACYYELHNGGHAFFRALDPNAPSHDPRRAAFGQKALLGLYKAVDAGLARVRQAIGPDADLLVCSPKGFRANTNGQTVLPDVLTGLGHQVAADSSGRVQGIRAARALVRAAAPRPLRRKIFGRLSVDERDRILEDLWIQSVDWARSRAFAEPDLGSGFVRLNVRGREPEGRVEPGEEYESLIADLTADLEELSDARTGAPAVRRVYRRDEMAPGPNCDLLPDLVVGWTTDVRLDAVCHPRLGTVRERMRDVPTSEHTGAAFVIGTGPRFRRAVAGPHAHLADIAATVLQLAGARLPHDMDGQPLAPLLDPSVPCERRQEIDWSLDPWQLRR